MMYVCVYIYIYIYLYIYTYIYIYIYVHKYKQHIICLIFFVPNIIYFIIWMSTVFIHDTQHSFSSNSGTGRWAQAPIDPVQALSR